MERKAHGLWTQTDLDASLSFITNLLWNLGPVHFTCLGLSFCVHKNVTLAYLPSEFQ